MPDKSQGEYLPLLPLPSPRVPVHLCILAGADNRAGVIRNTIRVCERYFRRVHVVDTGSTDETEAACRSFPKVNYGRLDGFWGETRAAYAEAVRDVPLWEWFLMLDSDERPSQAFLDHISAVIDEATARRLNGWYFSLFMHMWKDGAIDCRDGPEGRSAGFHVYRFWQKHPDLCAVGWGAHGGFRMRDPGAAVVAEFPVQLYFIHCKTWNERQLGTFVFSWVWPESHSIPAGTREHHELTAVKERLRLNNCNTLSAMVYTGTLPVEVVELMETWHARSPRNEVDEKQLRVPHEMASFVLGHYARQLPIEKYGRCGLPCCRYKCVQL